MKNGNIQVPAMGYILWHISALSVQFLNVTKTDYIFGRNSKTKPFKIWIEVPIQIQWGSEIQTSLDFEWSKRGWVANGLDFEWVLKYGSPVIWNHCHFVKKTKTFEIRKKCLNFECSGFWMVVTKAISIAKVRPF